MRFYRLFFLFALALIGFYATSAAQVLYLEESESDESAIEVAVGDVVEVEVHADLGRFSASGITFFVSIPCGPFEVVDYGDHAREGVRPFEPGGLFQGSIEAGNTLVYGDEVPDLSEDQLMLSYAAILGPGARRGRTGSGVVARFELLCLEPVHHARIAIKSSPIRETRLVLDDGFTERPFSAVQGLEITVGTSTVIDGKNSWGEIKAEFTD